MLLTFSTSAVARDTRQLTTVYNILVNVEKVYDDCSCKKARYTIPVVVLNLPQQQQHVSTFKEVELETTSPTYIFLNKKLIRGIK